MGSASGPKPAGPEPPGQDRKSATEKHQPHRIETEHPAPSGPYSQKMQISGFYTVSKVRIFDCHCPVIFTEHRGRSMQQTSKSGKK